MTTDKTAYNEAQTTAPLESGTFNVMLWATAPANAPSATNELSGDSYTSVSVDTANISVTNAGGPRTLTNDTIIDFGVLDTTTDKTVEGIVIGDGNGNYLYYDDFGGSSEIVSVENKFEIGINDLTVTED